MGGMVALQWKLSPADARLILTLLNREAVTSVADERRDQAIAMHAYLANRVIRLWGAGELAEPAEQQPNPSELDQVNWTNQTGPI